jgi:hypothetical protein
MSGRFCERCGFDWSNGDCKCRDSILASVMDESDWYRDKILDLERTTTGLQRRVRRMTRARDLWRERARNEEKARTKEVGFLVELLRQRDRTLRWVEEYSGDTLRSEPYGKRLMEIHRQVTAALEKRRPVGEVEPR